MDFWMNKHNVCWALAALMTLAMVWTGCGMQTPGRAAELLSVGSPAPDFSLQASVAGQVKTVQLRDYRGKNLIVVFYPMDQTPGCTVQLCNLRDGYPAFQAANTEGVAINPADLASHAAFAQKQHYPFALLSDPGKKVAQAYGAQGELGWNKRTVYIIDGQGLIRFAQRGTPTNEELLEVIGGLPPTATNP
jgi:peroxiredoxin Q/BCP